MSKKKMTLKDLDFNNIGSWPREWQLGFCVIVALVILVLLWNFLTSSKGDQLEQLEHEETSKRTVFMEKADKAANLEPLKQQLTQMEQQLQQMLRQLPSKTEMPDLIVDISQTALATGIQNELFQPREETPRDFYAEKPIDLKMVGSYHQFGAFVSGVASLPRVVIMTMHDISLKPRESKSGKGIVPGAPLELAGTIKTYRYRDETETSATATTGSPGGTPAPGAAATPAQPATGGSR